jgi:hypothetical protein
VAAASRRRSSGRRPRHHHFKTLAEKLLPNARPGNSAGA